MKVLLIGANGQIGRIITDKMQESDKFDLTAGYRKDDQMNEAQARGIQVAKVDLEKDIKHLEEAMVGMDAVVFSAGSGGSTGADRTMMIDLDGAVKSIEAAKRQNVKRFVMVSAVNANRREVWSYAMDGSSTSSYYHAAKYYADEWLMNSGLDYTIIRPTGLLNEPGTGKVEAAEYIETKDRETVIPREDVASVILESLQADNTINKAFDLNQGEDRIADAISEI